MKKAIIKILIWIISFVLALYICGRVMNKENVNLTTDMSIATLPLITMEKGDIRYNQLHGYLENMDIRYQLESLTEIGEDREIAFEIKNYGVRIDSIALQVRTVNGDRLIENTEIKDYESETGKLIVKAKLKDLIEKDQEYALTILLKDAQGRDIRYYTRITWSDQTRATEKLRFIRDFHDKTLDKSRVSLLSQYMESNSKGDNTTLHKVNIHSNLDQLSYGELGVSQDGETIYTLKDLNKSTATVVAEFTLVNDREETFRARETYRIRYTTDRVYLLDYERTMWQLPNMQKDDFQGDKIALGITNEDMQLVESEDGNIIGFVSYGNLYGYNLTNNNLTKVYSYNDNERSDVRDDYKNYDIKILGIDQDQNMYFAVYGYMNRGLHEGEVGIQLSVYRGSKNTLEEIIYIPSVKSAEIVRNDMNKLLYYSPEGILYYYMDHGVYAVNVLEKTQECVANASEEQGLGISDNQKIIAWTEGKDFHMMNLESAFRFDLQAKTDEFITPIAFMGEDVIYGVTNKADVYMDQSGRETSPMYKICISNIYGKILKEYNPEGIYVVDCHIEGNQLSLEQVKKTDSGAYVETLPEQIVSNEGKVSPKNSISVVAIDIYEQFVQIKLKGNVSDKTLQVLTPKWVVYEEDRGIEPIEPSEDMQWYAYGMDGLMEVTNEPAKAILAAYPCAGYVTDSTGAKVWVRGNRVTKNQIMAIKERGTGAGENTLSVCLDTILTFEGISRDVPELLSQGKTAMEILEESLPDYEILDLEGCPMDAVLYYVNKDIPVMAMVEKGQSVLIVGFNEYNVVIMEPSTGRLYKKGMNDSAKWFEDYGNKFITYSK